MTSNQVIGMSHGKQEPMENGRYHDIIHRDIIHHDVIHFALTKMADLQTVIENTFFCTPDLIYTLSGLIFQNHVAMRHKVMP